MADINLLPWRAKKREKQNNLFKQQLLLTFVLGLFLALVMRQFYQHQLNQQQGKNNKLGEQTQALLPQLDEIKKIKSQQTFLQKHLVMVEQLAVQQQNEFQLWQTLAKVKPVSLYFTQIKRDPSQIVLFGRASNAKQVTQLSNNLANSKWCHAALVRSVNQESAVFVNAPNNDIPNKHAPNNHNNSSKNNLVRFELACQLKQSLAQEEAAL